MDDSNCSRSWQAYGLAAVSGVLIIETFIISVYFFARHNRRSTTLKNRVKFDKVESSSRYTNSSHQNGHGITSVSVISETTEQTTTSENRRLESLHEHIKQNGLAKGTGDVRLQKSSDPVQDLSAQELQPTPITMVGKKSSNGKQRERHQRIDPYHRSKKRADIIRMNSAGSTDEERDANATKTKVKKKNSDKKLKNKRNKLPNKSQKGIMKPSNQDVSDKNGSAKQDSVSSRKKSVRFALERQNESEVKTVSSPTTPEKSKISIISANRPKHDQNNIDDILRGYSEEDVAAEKVSGKRQFIMISDEEDEPAIVEIETKEGEKSDSKGNSNQTTVAHQNTDDDGKAEDDDSIDGKTIQDSNLPQSNSPKEDKNNNVQKMTETVYSDGTNKQTTLTDETSAHHDLQIKTAETTPPKKMNILTSPQSVVLVEKNEEAATTSQNASNTTNQISTSDNGNISSVKEADNIRNPNVKIIPLENEEDGVVQSKRSIANGHVNSMIKMFQKLDDGKELSEEFNC